VPPKDGQTPLLKLFYGGRVNRPGAKPAHRFNVHSRIQTKDGDLTAFDTDHRIFFPRLAMLGLGHLTRYDVVAEMYVFLGGLAITLALVLAAARLTLEPRAALIVGGVAPFLLFDLRQNENMLFGIQILVVFFTVVFWVATLLVLQRVTATPGTRRWWLFAAAVASALVASFSSLLGLFVWPAGLLVLALDARPASPRRLLIPLWIGMAAAASVVYFQGYSTTYAHPSVFTVLGQPRAAARFFVTMLGSSLFGRDGPALGAGIALLVAAAVATTLVIRRRESRRLSFWLGLATLSLLAVVSVTLGRGGFGLSQALVSRYTSFSLLSVVAIVAVLAPQCRCSDKGNRPGQRCMSMHRVASMQSAWCAPEQLR